MQYEIDKVKDSTPSLVLAGEMSAPETVRTPLRKALNLAALAAVHDGALRGKLDEVLPLLARLTVEGAKAMVVLNKQPDAEAFRHAAAQLVTLARLQTDVALRENRLEDFAVCATMTEIVVRGIFAALGQDYFKYFDEEAG